MHTIRLFILLLFTANLYAQQKVETKFDTLFLNYNNLAPKPIKDIADLPDYIKNDLVDFIREYNPPYILAFGSFIDGHYHHKGLKKEWIQAKKEFYAFLDKPMREQSDLDIICISPLPNGYRYGNLQVFNTGSGIQIYTKPIKKKRG